MSDDYQEHVDAYTDLFKRADHRVFFSISDAPGRDETTAVVSTGMDESRLTMRQADLLQLVLLSRHVNELADIFDVPERQLLEIARHWDLEADGDIEGLLREAPHPLEDAPQYDHREGSDYKIDERLE